MPTSMKASRWFALLFLATIGTSIAFNCATPFAACAAIAGLYMRRGDAMLLMALVWFANQFVGFAFLDYPQTANSFAWGAALLIVALGSAEAARLLAHMTLHADQITRHLAAFVTAYIASQLLVFTAGLGLGGSDLSLDVQATLVTINACTYAGLLVLYRFASSLGLISRPAARAVV